MFSLLFSPSFNHFSSSSWLLRCKLCKLCGLEGTCNYCSALSKYKCRCDNATTCISSRLILYLYNYPPP